MKSVLGTILSIGLLLSSGGAFAHELKTALTRVVFNARSGNIEVMHRFYVHDAEHGVKQLFEKSADLLNSEQTQQTFSHYVSEQFLLQTSEGENLSLTLVGGQLDGRYFWVYQETPIPPTLLGLRVKHTSLQQLWPSQVNVVNIEGRGKIQSLSFDKDTSWQQIIF